MTKSPAKAKRIPDADNLNMPRLDARKDSFLNSARVKELLNREDNNSSELILEHLRQHNLMELAQAGSLDAVEQQIAIMASDPDWYAKLAHEYTQPHWQKALERIAKIAESKGIDVKLRDNNNEVADTPPENLSDPKNLEQPTPKPFPDLRADHEKNRTDGRLQTRADADLVERFNNSVEKLGIQKKDAINEALRKWLEENEPS